MARQGKRHIPKRCEAPDAPVKQMLCGRSLAPNDDPALAPCLMCLDGQVVLAMGDMDAAQVGQALFKAKRQVKAAVRAANAERHRRGYG